MSKQRESKLDRYAAALLAMDDEKKTLSEMQAWLKEEAVTVTVSRISSFLEFLRSARLQDKLLGQITSGARQCAAVEKQFGRNPAPAVETLVKLFRVIILQLATDAQTRPELLEMVSSSFKSVMAAEKLNLKREELSQGERKLTILEKKSKQADATEKVLTDKELSTEERAQRIKEIYGR